MGEEFTLWEPPSISIKLWGRTDFAKVHVIKDGNCVYSIEPNSRLVGFVWRDSAAEEGKTNSLRRLKMRGSVGRPSGIRLTS